MKLINERPSALFPACAQVGVLGRSAAAAAHLLVGRPARWSAPVADARQIQLSTQVAVLAASVYGAKGITGFTGNGIETSAQRQVDGASGVPPRGRPV